jgi:hypothetical protein
VALVGDDYASFSGEDCLNWLLVSNFFFGDKAMSHYYKLLGQYIYNYILCSVLVCKNGRISEPGYGLDRGDNVSLLLRMFLQEVVRCFGLCYFFQCIKRFFVKSGFRLSICVRLTIMLYP